MDDVETSAAETDLQNEEECQVEDEDLESIRFSSYRTASKLRALQKKSLLHHIDIWNMIEAFRENGLNESVGRGGSGGAAEGGNVSLGEARLRSLVNSLYVNLGKRLPPGPAIRDEGNVLFTWLLTLSPKTKIRSVKTALAALAAGKLMDKLRYVFSQCADGNGVLIHKRFNQFLRDLLKLPHSLGEYEAYKSSSSSYEVIFPQDSRINVNDFLETMMSDPGPSCLSWLLVLHRIINAEAIHHPVTCGYCRVRGFNGLRYKSDRANYHLCQNCFWRGKIGPEHKDDVFKEYNSYKSSSGRSSFKKSLQCIGNKSNEVHTEGKISRSKSKTPSIPNFPEQEVPIPMSNALPHHPPTNNGFLTPKPSSRCTTPRHPPSHPSYSSLPRMDQRLHHSTPARSSSDAGGSFMQSDEMQNATTDEHSLIAEYTHRLNDESRNNSTLHSRQLVQELERKNQEIIRDITKLRQNSNSFSYPRGGQPSRGGGVAYADPRPLAVGGPNTNPMLINELHGLRSRKEDLDQRLTELQSTRKDLMTELEELMKLLKNQRMFVPSNNGNGNSATNNPGHPQFLAPPQQHFLLQKQLQSQKLRHHQQAQISSYLGEMEGGHSPESYPPNPSSVASLSD